MLTPATQPSRLAEHYLDAQLRGPHRPAMVTYDEARAAVQAALDAQPGPPDLETLAITRLLDDPGDPVALAVVNARLVAPEPMRRQSSSEEPPF